MVDSSFFHSGYHRLGTEVSKEWVVELDIAYIKCQEI